MELPYNSTIFHDPRKVSSSVKPGNRQDASSRETKTHLRSGVAELFGSVASQAVRLPFDAVSTATHFAFHPEAAFNAAYDVFRNGENEKLARRTRLLQELRDANSWSEYNATCILLDQLEGAEVWKDSDTSDLYDVNCLRGRLTRLIEASDRDDVEELVDLVRCELTRDLGGISDPALHQQTRSGTKFLIDHYVKTIREILDRIVSSCSHGDRRLNKIDVQMELEDTRRSYGRTALFLSGGGTWGMNHIGVIKGLHEANALPRIISGSSSGSIVAAVLGATPDEELLSRLHDFCHGDLAVFVGAHEEQGLRGRIKHFHEKGHLFDLGNLRRVMVDLLGKTTFLEAYNQTRRVLNIAVSNSSQYESHQVLNYATAGNVVIWSAVVASCAVPFGFEPERLLCKREDERKDLVPWDPSSSYVDGSINGDLPTDILSAEFDVNHSIVSQVNPHVVPFLKPVSASHAVSKTPYWISGANLAKEEAIRSLEILADLPCLQRESNIITKLSSVLRQRYSGDITLVPLDSIARYWTILENPTSASMEDSARKGERAIWPVLSMIKTHMDIELMIDNALRKVSEHVSFSDSVRDLRKMQLTQASRASNHSSGGRLRHRRGRNRSLSAHRHASKYDHLSVKVLPPDRPNRLVVKLPGEAISAGSRSSSVSLSSESDDDKDDESGFYMADHRATKIDALSLPLSPSHSLTVQTQPNTPASETRSLLGSPRSGSPSPKAPISLLMTPVTPRASSPESTYKKQSSSGRQTRSGSRSPSSTSRVSSNTQSEHSWRSKLFSIEIPRRIRSTSIIPSDLGFQAKTRKKN